MPALSEKKITTKNGKNYTTSLSHYMARRETTNYYIFFYFWFNTYRLCQNGAMDANIPV